MMTVETTKLPQQSSLDRAIADDHQLPRRRAQLLVKRGIDIVVASAALAVLMWPLLAAAIWLRMTGGGPLLFVQEREGRNGVPFRMYKLRTMHVARCDLSGIAQTVHGDDRVTPAGRLLRRYSLDELPQFINVLRGEMSLIGPRPHVCGMLAAGMPYHQFVPEYCVRLAMRPGITGLAQSLDLRGPTLDPEDARSRIACDLKYIAGFSLWLDLKIALRTVLLLRHGTGV